jgi:hypothetical protein
MIFSKKEEPKEEPPKPPEPLTKEEIDDFTQSMIPGMD